MGSCLQSRFDLEEREGRVGQDPVVQLGVVGWGSVDPSCQLGPVELVYYIGRRHH